MKIKRMLIRTWGKNKFTFPQKLAFPLNPCLPKKQFKSPLGILI